MNKKQETCLHLRLNNTFFTRAEKGLIMIYVRKQGEALSVNDLFKKAFFLLDYRTELILRLTYTSLILIQTNVLEFFFV
jgi:hypothetical protein